MNYVLDNCERMFSCKSDVSPAKARCDGDTDADDGRVPDEADSAIVDPVINVSAAGGENKRANCCDSSTQTDLFGITSLFQFVPDASPTLYRES